MTIERTDRTVVTEGPTALTGQQTAQTNADPSTVRTDLGRQTVRTDSSRITTGGPEGAELTRRVIVLLFGLIQIVIGLRFVLLLLDARESNGIVSGILNFSQLFVAPFEGVLKTNSLHAAGSTFDMAAIVAFVGWTVIELIVLWVIGIFRREPA